MIRSSLMEPFRGSGDPSTQGDFALAEGYTAATFETLRDTYRLKTLGVDDEGPRYLGAALTFLGRGADNATYNYRVYAVFRGREKDVHLLRLVCSGVATLGATLGVGPAGSIAPTTDRVVDKLTLTVSAWGTHDAAARGHAGPVIHSPDDATPAQLTLADMGGAVGIIVEFDLVTATAASANLELIT